MAKNKKQLLILLPLVLLIWGLIGYRFFILSSDKTIYQESSILTFENHISLNDTFSLLNNYRDPFLSKSLKPLPSQSFHIKPLPTPNVSPKPIVQPKKEEDDAPKIKYYGMVINKEYNKTVGIISNNSSRCIISVGDTVGALKVQKMTKDAIFFEKNGKLALCVNLLD